MLSIRELEKITGYDFFSNLSRKIQDAIKNNTDIGDLAASLTSGLLAFPELSEASFVVVAPVSGIDHNSSVGQYGFPKEGFVEMNPVPIFGRSQPGLDQDRPSKSSPFQISSPQVSPSQISITEICPSQISISQQGLSQIGIRQIGSTQVSSYQPSRNQFGATQVGFAQISVFQETMASETRASHASTLQVSTSEITRKGYQIKLGTTEISPTQINSTKFSFSQIDVSQINTNKVFFPSSIPSEQFLSSHNSSPYSIYNINNSAIDLSNSPNLLNGNFDITNPNDPDYGWNQRGAGNIFNSQATLTEDSLFLSNFSQTFTISEGAKTLQFTLTSTQLGHSEGTPPDAFEVALLDANTLNPLVGTTVGLTQTDSLFNLQADDISYFKIFVKLSNAITIDCIGLRMVSKLLTFCTNQNNYTDVS